MGGSGITWIIWTSFAPHCRQITMPAPHHSPVVVPGLCLLVYIGWSDVTVICGHILIYVVGATWCNMSQLSGADLSRYSNEIDSVGLRNGPYYHLEKWSYNYKYVSKLALHHGGQTAGIDVVWRNFVTVTLRILACLSVHQLIIVVQSDSY